MYLFSARLTWECVTGEEEERFGSEVDMLGLLGSKRSRRRVRRRSGSRETGIPTPV